MREKIGKLKPGIQPKGKSRLDADKGIRIQYEPLLKLSGIPRNCIPRLF